MIGCSVRLLRRVHICSKRYRFHQRISLITCTARLSTKNITNLRLGRNNFNSVVSAVSYNKSIFRKDLIKTEPVYKDGSRLKQCLANLGSNANLLDSLDEVTKCPFGEQVNYKLDISQLLDLVAQSLRTYRKEDLQKLIELLFNLHNNLREKILVALDLEMARRTVMWNSSVCLYYLDAIYHLVGNRVTRTKFFSCVQDEWPKKIIKTTVQNNVQLCYYLGLKKVDNKNLLAFLEEMIERKFKELSFSEVGLVCDAFFKCSHKVTNPHLITKIKELTEKEMTNNEQDLNQFALISVVKCFRLSGYGETGFLTNLSSFLIKQTFVHYSFAECVHLLAAFANKAHYDRQLYSLVDEHCLNLIRTQDPENAEYRTHPSYRIRVKDISRLLWAMSHTGHNAKEGFYSEIIAELERRFLDPFEYELAPEKLLDCLHSLVVVGLYPEKLLELSGKIITVESLLKTGKDKAFRQLKTVKRSAAIERPSLKCALLDLSFDDIQTRLDSRRTVLEDILYREKFNDVYEIFKAWDSDLIQCGYALDHIEIAGFSFAAKLDMKNNELKLARIDENRVTFSDGLIARLTGSGSELVQSCVDTENYWFHSEWPIERISVEVLDRSVVVQNDNIIGVVGLMDLKIRLLRKLNYRVFLFEPKDFERMSIGESINHVYGIIRRELTK